MSTTLDRRKARKNYAEFDEYISFQLQKTQTGIRSTDIFTALCGAAVFVISYLLIFVIFDHWVVTGGFGSEMRVVLLSGLLIGTLAWLGWKVLWPCFRRVNSMYAAKTLEQASPELKSTLLNYVDLRAAKREVAPAIIGSMEKRAAVTLSHTEVDDAIDRSTLLRLSYALLVAVVLFSAYAVASPKKVWPSIVRIFAPAAEVSVSTQTAFLNVDPGDTQVLAREFLTVTTDLSGEVPQDVTLLYTTDDQQFVDEPISMHEVEAGLKRYQCILKGNGSEGLLQGLSYRIVAGDASTRTYTVTVTQPPSASIKSLHYTYPDYMELPPEIAAGSSIDTWEGTQIEFEAEANTPIEMAWLQFSDETEFPARCEELRMKVSDDGLHVTGLWQPIIREDGSYPAFYRVQCRTADGATDPAPAVHTIQINPDQKPEVSTLQPNRDIEVAANAIVPLLIHTSDPDFRLSRVFLRMENGSRPLPDQTLYKGNDPQKRILHEVKLANLNAKPGDVITWWIEAHDNRLVETPIRTLLDANRSTSPRLKFIVKAPMPQEDVNEQFEHDKQRALEKLDELDQQNGSDQSPEKSNSESPDQQPESDNDPQPGPDESDRKQDENTPEEQPPADERNPSEDDKGKGAGDPSGGDTDSASDDNTEKGDNDAKGETDGERSEKGNGEPGEEGDKPDTGEQKTESGPRKPVSNDGSQDDQILRELLKHNRDSKKDAGKDNSDKKDDGNQNESQKGSREGDKPDSPQSNGDKTTDDPSAGKTDQPDAKSQDKTHEPDASSNSQEKSQKPKTDGNSPNKPSDDPSARKPTDGMPSDNENDNSKGDQAADSESTDSQNKDSAQEKSSDSGNTPPSADSNQSDNKPDDGTGKSDNDSSKDTTSDSGANSESGMPNSKGSPGGNEESNSSPGDNPSSKDTENKQRPDDGPGKNMNGSTSKQSPAEKPGKGKTEGDPSNRPAGEEGSKASSSENGKPDSDSSQGKPGGSETDNPGSGKTESNPGQGKPDTGAGNDSKPDNGQKPGDGNSGKSDSPGKPGGQPGKGSPGKSKSGEPGNGQNAQPGSTTGQGRDNAPPRVGSDSGDNRVKQPDDNANPNEAVQRQNSGANMHDPNLPDADGANLEDKLKASNMVLKRLQKELNRGEVDPELLKKLGWTEKDMQQFAERLERQLAQPKPDDPAAEARRRQFEEVLRSVDLDSSGRQQEGIFNEQKSTNNFSGRRLKAPRQHRKAYEEYLKRLSRQRRGTSDSSR